MADFPGVTLTPAQVLEAEQQTTLELIASVVVYPAGTVLTLSGFTTSGDGGGAQWKLTATTGTASQSPAQLGDALLNDANGNQWALVIVSGKINTVSLGDGGSDSYGAFQAAINALTALTGGDVITGPGLFLTSQQVRLKNNVRWLLSDEATIRRNYNTSPTGASLIGIEEDNENVTVKGGTLDVNGSVFTTGADGIVAIGISNLKVIGVTFLNVPEFHAIDVARATDVLISECKFLGFADHSATRGFSEAIQLDPDLVSGTGSDNLRIIVINNIFGENPDNTDPAMVAWPVAMGSHSAAEGNFSKDILFSGNKITDATYAGVRLFNFNDVIITDNSFVECNRGVRLDFRLATGLSEGNSNIIVNENNFLSNTREGIYFADPGFTTVTGFARHQGIVIDSNIFTGLNLITSYAIRLAWAENTKVTGNNIRESNGGVRARFCSSLTVTDNDIADVSINGVLIEEITETDFIGTGESKNIKISGGLIDTTGFRGVHINCAADFVDILGVTIIDFDGDAGGREGIKVDTSPSNVTIMGNTVKNTSASTSDYSISATSATVVTVANNSADQGTIRAYNVTAASSSVHIEDTGSPEGVFAARVGSTYTRLDGGAGTTLYIKETGTGDTGWVAK